MHSLPGQTHIHWFVRGDAKFQKYSIHKRPKYNFDRITELFLRSFFLFFCCVDWCSSSFHSQCFILPIIMISAWSTAGWRILGGNNAVLRNGNEMRFIRINSIYASESRFHFMQKTFANWRRTIELTPTHCSGNWLVHLLPPTYSLVLCLYEYRAQSNSMTSKIRYFCWF